MSEFQHATVLLAEAVDLLAVRPGGVYVDATLGGGGHAEAILDRLDGGMLFAFDQDAYAIARATARLGDRKNLVAIQANFTALAAELAARGVDAVDGVLYDLGVSSFQFDMPERGFSYRFDSPLDMRMDTGQRLSAYDVVNGWSEARLADILFRYGEEAFARKIAKAIADRRQERPIATTFELVELIRSALPARILAKPGHPAKQSFQAIRIAVNDELTAFSASLAQAAKLVRPGGRIVAITFHSLEDRIAKQYFRSLSTLEFPKGMPIPPSTTAPFDLVTAHPVVPSDAEIEANPRAKSAKLRAIMKKENAGKLFLDTPEGV